MHRYIGNIGVRVLSAVILMAVFCYAIFFSFALFASLVTIIYLGMIAEWNYLVKDAILDKLLGFSLLTLATTSVFILKSEAYGSEIIFWYGSIITCFDSAAFIGGKLIGGPKLAPKISPQKTWAGFICGIAISFLVSYLIQSVVFVEAFKDRDMFKYGHLLPSLFIALLAQIGDLLESSYKRKYGVKDTGNVIPGHGGLLDRFDSVILSAPALVILLW